MSANFPADHEVRDEVASGLRYAHFRADANTSKLLEVASFLYAAIDLLSQRGLLDLEELNQRKREATANLVEKVHFRSSGRDRLRSANGSLRRGVLQASVRALQARRGRRHRTVGLLRALYERSRS
jgi:hypothetical protein